jgi:hypothetical protein
MRPESRWCSSAALYALSPPCASLFSEVFFCVNARRAISFVRINAIKWLTRASRFYCTYTWKPFWCVAWTSIRDKIKCMRDVYKKPCLLRAFWGLISFHNSIALFLLLWGERCCEKIQTSNKYYQSNCQDVFFFNSTKLMLPIYKGNFFPTVQHYKFGIARGQTSKFQLNIFILIMQDLKWAGMSNICNMH